MYILTHTEGDTGAETRLSHVSVCACVCDVGSFNVL